MTSALFACAFPGNVAHDSSVCVWQDSNVFDLPKLVSHRLLSAPPQHQLRECWQMFCPAPVFQHFVEHLKSGFVLHPFICQTKSAAFVQFVHSRSCSEFDLPRLNLCTCSVHGSGGKHLAWLEQLSVANLELNVIGYAKRAVHVSSLGGHFMYLARSTSAPPCSVQRCAGKHMALLVQRLVDDF